MLIEEKRADEQRACARGLLQNLSANNWSVQGGGGLAPGAPEKRAPLLITPFLAKVAR
jgi:hypothetical protein